MELRNAGLVVVDGRGSFSTFRVSQVVASARPWKRVSVRLGVDVRGRSTVDLIIEA